MLKDFKNKFGDIPQLLESAGFKPAGSVWSLKKDGFRVLVSFQKSNYSAEYYVIVGLLLGNTAIKKPRVHQADIQFRIIDSSCQPSRDSFDLEAASGDVKQLIRKQLLDQFSSVNTVQELALIIRRDPEKYILTVRAKSLLPIEA